MTPQQEQSPRTDALREAAQRLVDADTIDMNCGWDSPSCHFCLRDTEQQPHADDCPWAEFRAALREEQEVDRKREA